jgi:hypothetical protein
MYVLNWTRVDVGGGGCRDCNAADPHFYEEFDRIVL